MIIRRYPAKKEEFEEYISDIMSVKSNDIGNVADSNNKAQSVTESAALKMTSAYVDKLKREIEAVEFVYNNLRPEEQKVVQERYWTNRNKNIPYLKLRESNYSERQMKRICFKVIQQVGKYLGEIK